MLKKNIKQLNKLNIVLPQSFKGKKLLIFKSTDC